MEGYLAFFRKNFNIYYHVGNGKKPSKSRAKAIVFKSHQEAEKAASIYGDMGGVCFADGKKI